MKKFNATVNGILLTADTRAELVRMIAELCQK